MTAGGSEDKTSGGRAGGTSMMGRIVFRNRILAIQAVNGYHAGGWSCAILIFIQTLPSIVDTTVQDSSVLIGSSFLVGIKPDRIVLDQIVVGDVKSNAITPGSGNRFRVAIARDDVPRVGLSAADGVRARATIKEYAIVAVADHRGPIGADADVIALDDVFARR